MSEQLTSISTVAKPRRGSGTVDGIEGTYSMENN